MEELSPSFLFWFNISVLSIILLASLAVVWRVRLSNLDLAMILIVLSYIISFSLRVFLVKASLNLASTVAAIITWSFLFYFVFQMKRVRNKLASNTIEEFLQKDRTLK